MTSNLPEFIYHPDPVASGVIKISDAICVCCQQARGYIYTGPVYSTDELNDALCPWCIADGSAHDKLDASFNDEAGIGGYGDWEAVSKNVVEIVAYRTPSFIGWQQEKWWTHCADAAVFLGVVGYNELRNYGEQAVEAIAKECAFTGKELKTYMMRLKKNGSPTAYLFKCRHCGLFGGYSDFD
jgi:uncharacterized protein